MILKIIFVVVDLNFLLLWGVLNFFVIMFELILEINYFGSIFL